MGVPVVVARNNLGYPIRPVKANAPVLSVSSNGLGVPVVVSERGVPFILQGYNTGPEIRVEGSGYAGSTVTSTMAGIWYVDGVAAGAGFTYTIKPEDEGKPIYLRTEPAVWVKYGQSGYAGSVYQANFIGQFYANGSPIAGAVGEEWTMTPELEGAEISFAYVPAIWVEGSGYAGSVYHSNLPVVWYANGVAIPDAVGYEWVMTPQYEGAEISGSYELAIWISEGPGYAGSVISSNGTGSFVINGVARPDIESELTITPEMEGAEIAFEGEITAIEDRPEVNMQSNTIQMFAPITLTTAQKTNGGQWGADIQTTAVRDGATYVTAWTDRFGVRDMTQATAVDQPKFTTVDGYPAAVWEAGLMRNQGLIPAATFSAKWWFVMATYKSGAASFTDHNTLILAAASITNGRFSGLANTSNMDTAAMSNIRRNGAEPNEVGLPLVRGSLSGTSLLANIERPWAIGRAWNPNDAVRKRDWEGEIFAALALPEEPDTATRQRIEGYYHWKYGVQSSLPLDHPFRNTPPRIQ